MPGVLDCADHSPAEAGGVGLRGWENPGGDRRLASTAVVVGKPEEQSSVEEASDGWAALCRCRLLLFQQMGLSKAHADLGIAGRCGTGRCAM